MAIHFRERDPAIGERAREVVRSEVAAVLPQLQRYRADLTGKRAAVYVGGAFKAFSLVRALRTLGMRTVVAGSQTGSAADYQQLRDLCDPETILVDDTNPVELAGFIKEKQVDLFIGGVKERPLAYKLGVAFCDHNHERKHALAGYAGMLNFAAEVHASVTSPVWHFVPRAADSAVAARRTQTGAGKLPQMAVPDHAEPTKFPPCRCRSRPS